MTSAIDITADKTAITLHNSATQVAPFGHYSHMAVHAGLAYISGQLPVDPTGKPLGSESFDEQAR